MKAKPRVARPATFVHCMAVAVAAAFGIAILAGIVTLFSHDGAPFERAVVAERACADYAYASDRAQCMAQFVMNAERAVIAAH